MKVCGTAPNPGAPSPGPMKVKWSFAPSAAVRLDFAQDKISSVAPAPAPAAQNRFIDSIDLGAGAHCIEVLVMVTGGAQSLKLSYAGPDTKASSEVIPGQVVHC